MITCDSETSDPSRRASALTAPIHLLNPAGREHQSYLRMSLGLIHPREVDVILSAFRLNYGALDIPPRSEARFTGECDFTEVFDAIIQQPMDLKLHWVLPHYHYPGNYFSVEILGGARDDEVIHSLDTFNAEPNGKSLDPPIDLAAAGARGLRMTCGDRNPRDESVGFGIGDQEMCVMLGLAESSMLMSAFVGSDNQIDGVVDGIVMNSGPCTGIGAPNNPAQNHPSSEEMEAPLYVPDSLASDVGLPVAPPCVDTPVVRSEPPTTLTGIDESIFVGSCVFSACHDDQAPAGGLDLSQDLYANLLTHDVTTAETNLPLVAPGDPDGSWLYQVLSKYAPEDDTGRLLAHMPRNSPQLLPAELVTRVRDWILLGALDD